MIQLEGDCRSGSCRLLLFPNRPLSWSGTQAVWLLISIPSLGFALALSLMGFWPILPFAGLEVGLLYLAFYISSHRQYQQEQLSLSRTEIIIRRRRRGRSEQLSLPRAWTRLRIQRGPGRWHPERVSLLYCGRSTEIGAELTEEERRQLITTFTEAGIPLEA